MRTTYKNKRDFYKAEAQRLATENELKRQANEVISKQLEEIKKKCDEDKKKRYNADVYCSNCQKVVVSSVPSGQSIHESGCANCGAKNCGYLVVHYPGKF